MNISIIGTGGVGGYFGAKLAQAGHQVSFLARGAHLQTIQVEGLRVESILGDFQVSNVSASDQIKDLGPADLILICVKAWQVTGVAVELNEIMHENTIVLPLQNGVMATSELSEILPASSIMGGLCRIISKIAAPGLIRHIGVTPTIVFGELDRTLSERAIRLQATFDQAAIKSRCAEDIEADLWKKFIAICVSGLLAITHTTYGELREEPETRAMMIELINEVYAVSQKAGVNISADFPEKTISFIDSFPYESTSSLTRDVWEGKPSEIEYQNGTVVQLGKKLGVPVPLNRFIYHTILPMERKSRKKY